MTTPQNNQGAKPKLSAEEEERLFRATGRRVAAVVQMSRPEQFEQTLAESADLPVYGAFVSLKREGQLRSCCGYLSPTATLAEAVSHAADRAAKDDPRFPPIAAEELDFLDMEVWLLWGPEEVAARGEDRPAEQGSTPTALAVGRLWTFAAKLLDGRLPRLHTALHQRH